MNVIVTHTNNRIAYVAVKSLARRGLNIITADHHRLSMSFFSRYSANRFIYPSPYSDPDRFLQCLVEKIRHYRCDFILPTYEETFLVAKHQKILSDYTNLILPAYEAIMEVHNKDQLMRLAQKLGIPVPQTITINHINEIETVPHRIKFPVVIKPRQGGGSWAIEHIPSADVMKPLYERALTQYNLRYEQLLIQEEIPIGEKFSQAMVFNRGECCAKFTDQNLREYPASGGAGCFRISRSVPEIEGYTLKLLSFLNWHGVAEADYVTHKETGRFYLLDINPRLWGGLHSAIASGVDIPYLLYQIALGLPFEPVLNYHQGVKTRWFGGDLMAFWSYLAADPRKTKMIREFFNIFAKDVQLDDLDMRDPLPFFIWGVNTVRKFTRQVIGLPSPTEHLTGEWV